MNWWLVNIKIWYDVTKDARVVKQAHIAACSIYTRLEYRRVLDCRANACRMCTYVHVVYSNLSRVPSRRADIVQTGQTGLFAMTGTLASISGAAGPEIGDCGDAVSRGELLSGQV
jgi:hypothetical protein